MISYVIPSYNRAQGMIELIVSLKQQTVENIEIIVVDDCSPDDTNEQISTKFPEVVIIKNDENSGPAKSRHTGIVAAKYDIVVGLDSDVIVDDVALSQKVMEHFKDPDSASMLAFRLFTPEGVDDIQRWWHPKSVQTHANLPFETDYFSGTGYAIKKQDYLQSGGFSPLVYMHYEEVLLAYQMIDSGFTLQYEPSLSVIHNALPTTRRNKMKMFYKPRNQLLIATLCYPKASAVTFAIPRLIKNFLTALKHGELKEYFAAISDYMKMRPLLLENRRPLKQSTFEKIAKLRKG